MTTQRLFPSTSGPANVSAASGGWLLGVLFSPQGKMAWLNGYYHWVPSNGDTVARKFALWNPYAVGTQALVAGSQVTSGTMTQGAWNFVALPTPIQLSPAALYCAAVGWTASAGIPVISAQFGSGDPFAAGIVNGYLTGWSATSGSKTFPAGTANFGFGQMMFSNVLGSDPGAAMPNNGSGDDFLGVDIQLSDTAPANYTGSYRFRPNQVDLGNYSLDTANGFTLGFQFSCPASAANNIWFYSPATVSVLPTKIGFFRTSDQSLVLVNAAPQWKKPDGTAASAGGGWCKAAITGTLAAGTYKAAVFQPSNVIWNAAVANFWTTGGFGANGLIAGPMSAPNTSGAVSPGQASYNTSTSDIAYPNLNVGAFDYGVDPEMTPVSSSGLLIASGII